MQIKKQQINFDDDAEIEKMAETKQGSWIRDY
jgi:hypothetical protein